DPFAAWEPPGGPTKPAAARAPSRAHGGIPAASDAREGGSRGSSGGGLGRPSHPGRRTPLTAVWGRAVAAGVAWGPAPPLAQAPPAAPNGPTAAVPAAPAGDG